MNKIAIGTGVVIVIAGLMLLTQSPAGISGGTVTTSSSFAAKSYNVSFAAENADIIVRGTVTDIGEGRWPTETGAKPPTVTEDDMKGIYHPVTIQVAETLKGPERSEITLRVGTGTVGNYTHRDPSAPSYREGEQVLVFVQEWNGHHRTLWKELGTFNIEQDVIDRGDVPDGYRSRINVSDLLMELRARYG